VKQPTRQAKQQAQRAKKEAKRAQKARRARRIRADGSKAPAKWYENKLVAIMLTAAFTLMGGIGLAVFKYWRDPKVFDAKLEKPTIETNVPLRKALAESGEAESQYTEAQLAQVGYFVHTQVTLVGFKGRKCSMRWEVFDADRGERIFFPDWEDTQTAFDLTPEGQTDIAAPKFWLPPTPDNKLFFVRVMIDDDKGTPLTSEQTAPVRPPPAAKTADTPQPSPPPTPSGVDRAK
jgi:hypothetical protein